MPDIKTVMLLYLIINIINAGAITVVWRQNRGRFAGISFWLVGLALQAAGPLLLVLRGLIPDIVSMTGSNTIILAGILIILIGLERFTGKKGGQTHNYVLLAVFMAVSAYFVMVQPNLMARDIAVSAIIMAYTFQCCWLLLHRVDPGLRQITRLTGIVFAAYAAFSLTRIILTVIIPEQSNDFFNSGAVNSLAITGYILISLCLIISLVLMVSRRLLADVKAQEEKFTTAFHSSPYAIIIARMSDGKIFEVNDGFVNIIGYHYAEAVGKTTLDLRLWVRKADRLVIVNELAQGREIHGAEYQFRKKTGEILTGLLSASPVTINNEKCILESIDDITERKKIEEEVKLISAEWQTTFDSITDLVSIQDKSYKLVRVNKAYADTFQMKPEELAGRHCYEVMHKTACSIANCPHEKALQTKAGTTSEIFEPSLGVYLEVSCSPIFNERGEMYGTVHIAKNITERKQLEQKLEKMATYDYLTGLPNRALLVDRFTVAVALARRNKSRIAVMSLDLDKFKTINDTLGHDAGDQVLKTVSTRLTGVIRASDTVARIGGDEFILVMLETQQRQDATAIAHKILESFTEPLSIDSQQLNISTSIGIAIYPEDGEDMETLIKKSDAAMYYVKGHGRHQFKFYGDGDVLIGQDHKSADPL